MTEHSGAVRYKYRALDAQGEVRHGELAAEDSGACARQLMTQGLTPVDIEALRTAPASSSRRPIQAADQQVFLQELATLLQAGISASEALPSLAQAYRGLTLGPAAARLDAEVKAGRGIAQSIAESGLQLPKHAQALLEAGEASGQLAAACADASRQLEHDLRVRAELRNALIYPSILITAGTLAVLIILIGVVPRFAGLLRNTRADVPALSRWVIELGVFLQQHALWVGLGVAAVFAVLVMAFQAPAVRERAQRALAEMPLIGPWLQEAETGRWAQLLGTLLANRVPIVKALQLAAAVVDLGSLRRTLARVGGEIERGAALSDVLARDRMFPPTRLNLIRVGERSGELATMLQRLGQMQIEAARQRQKRLLTLIEPLAILLIGAMIGFIMVAVMMAVTSLNAAAT
jgi:general secretion pathway protein F